MDPPRYVPPHLRNGGANVPAPVYHSVTWNPQRAALLAWLKLGNWKTGGQFVPKLKGAKGENPYYTVFYENAITDPKGKTFHICLNIHVYGEAGAAWISGVDDSFFELRNEPDTPSRDIELLWGPTARQTYVSKTKKEST
jgi:hypothetical protein